MNFFYFIYNLFCGTNETEERIKRLKQDLEPSDNFTIQRYLNRVQYRHNQYKFKKKSFKLLRLLQVLGGFSITTMTTYNNPYFKENSDKVNIVVWYVSISNNIFNMLIEKLNAYDLTTMKVMVDLLITEGELLLENEKDYRYYGEGEIDNKLIYFKDCYTDIQKNDPYNYLKGNIKHRVEAVNVSKNRRLDRVWAFPVPTPENNNVESL